MKKLLIVPVIALTATVSAYTPNAQASDVAQAVCEYVSADDKKRMRSFLKSNKLKIRNIFEGIQCNGQNLLEFAASNNSVKTGELIIKKLPKNTLSGLIASIQGAQDLVAIAQDRINS
jgi:hypothetical protein